MGRIRYFHNGDYFYFGVGGADYLTLTSTVLTMTGNVDLTTLGTDEYKIGGNRALAMPVDNTNIAIGYDAGSALITGAEGNVSMGYGAGRDMTTADHNISLGQYAGANNATGGKNVSIGYICGAGVAGPHVRTSNIAIGYRVLRVAEACVYNIGIGTDVFYDLTTGGYNVAIGQQSGYNITTGGYNVLLGAQTGTGLTTGGRNICIGEDAGAGITEGDSNVAVGHSSGKGWGTTSNNVAVGHSAESVNTGSLNTSIGAYASQRNTAGSANVCVGYEAGQVGAVGHSFSSCVFIGFRAGESVRDTTEENVFVGRDSGGQALTTAGCVFLGYQAGYRLASGNDNIAVGRQALRAAASSTAEYNIGMGYYAGYDITTGVRNVLIGFYNSVNITEGNSNIVVGGSAALALTTGSNNVILGHGAGASITTQSSNVFLGYESGKDEAGANKLYISNSDTSTPLIYGEFDNNLIKTDADVLPAASGTYDLGSATLPWAEGHFDDLYVDGIGVPDYVFDKFFDGEVKEGDTDIEIVPLTETIKYIETERHLPTMPSRKEAEENKQSIGELVTKLWETIEMQQLQIKELHERLEKMELN